MAINVKIKEELEDYLQNKAGKKRNRALIKTAYRLSEQEIESIKRAIPALKDFELDNEVDDSLLAGFVIKFGTKVIDLSLSGKLKSFKKLMYEID